MIRLVFSDLLLRARVWFGALAVTVAAGFAGAIMAGLVETGQVHGGHVQEVLRAASAAAIVFSGVAAPIVIDSVANLTVVLQQRSYALWQIVGIRPGIVSTTVLAQLGIVAAVGALVGALLAQPILPSLFAWTFNAWPELRVVTPTLGAVSTLAVVGAVGLAAVLGGFRGARRAGRTPPVEVLREPEPARVRLGWARAVFAVLVIIGTVWSGASLDGRAPMSSFGGQAVLLIPMVVACIALTGPLVYPLVLRVWTSLVPGRASVSWYLARRSARYRLGLSTAAISPLMVAIALAGGLYTTGGTLAAAETLRSGKASTFDIAPEAFVIILGGPLVLSIVAAASVVLMSGQAREREIALLQAAGASQPVIVRMAVWEALIYSVTALLLGLAAIVIGGAVVAAKLSLALPVVAFGPIVLIAATGFVVILAATLVPTCAALRRDVAGTLAVE